MPYKLIKFRDGSFTLARKNCINEWEYLSDSSMSDYWWQKEYLISHSRWFGKRTFKEALAHIGLRLKE